MSFNVAMLKAMQGEGLTLDAIIRILEVAYPLDTSAADKRKAYDRDRKRIARESAKSGGKSAGNPPDGFPNERDNLTLPVTPIVSNETTAPVVLKPEHVVEAWNDMAEPLGLPTVRKLTPERRKKLATRIRSNTIDEFTEAIAAVPRSPFLRGENGRGWKADFDWMLEPKNFTKLTEGTYDR